MKNNCISSFPIQAAHLTSTCIAASASALRDFRLMRRMNCVLRSFHFFSLRGCNGLRRQDSSLHFDGHHLDAMRDCGFAKTNDAGVRFVHALCSLQLVQSMDVVWMHCAAACLSVQWLGGVKPKWMVHADHGSKAEHEPGTASPRISFPFINLPTLP